MRGARAKVLRREADRLTIGKKPGWSVIRTIKKYLKGGRLHAENRDTLVNTPDSPRGVYLRLKKEYRVIQGGRR